MGIHELIHGLVSPLQRWWRSGVGDTEVGFPMSREGDKERWR